MKIRSILAGLLCAGLLSVATSAQVSVGNAGPSNVSGGGGTVPTNSPEPFTLIALGSGAVIAGGAAFRRKKRNA
jgi:hypothetical protein